jgi:hypothetical protein
MLEMFKSIPLLRLWSSYERVDHLLTNLGFEFSEFQDEGDGMACHRPPRLGYLLPQDHRQLDGGPNGKDVPPLGGGSLLLGACGITVDDFASVVVLHRGTTSRQRVITLSSVDC